MWSCTNRKSFLSFAWSLNESGWLHTVYYIYAYYVYYYIRINTFSQTFNLLQGKRSEQCTTVYVLLTADSRGNHHIQDLAAVPGINQLIGLQRVKTEWTATCFILCFYYHYHIETVARKFFSLEKEMKTHHVRNWHVDMCWQDVLMLV